jgi:hypothetical protein
MSSDAGVAGVVGKLLAARVGDVKFSVKLKISLPISKQDPLHTLDPMPALSLNRQ